MISRVENDPPISSPDNRLPDQARGRYGLTAWTSGGRILNFSPSLRSFFSELDLALVCDIAIFGCPVLKQGIFLTRGHFIFSTIA